MARQFVPTRKTLLSLNNLLGLKARAQFRVKTVSVPKLRITITFVSENNLSSSVPISDANSGHEILQPEKPRRESGYTEAKHAQLQ